MQEITARFGSPMRQIAWKIARHLLWEMTFDLSVIWEISLRDFLGDILRPSGQAQRRVPSGRFNRLIGSPNRSRSRTFSPGRRLIRERGRRGSSVLAA